MGNSKIGSSSQLLDLDNMVCFPHLKKVKLECVLDSGSRYSMPLDHLNDLYLPSLRVLDIERSGVHSCQASQWVKAAERWEHLLPSVEELMLTLPLETRSVAELFQKMQTVNTLRIVLKYNSSINAIRTLLYGDPEHHSTPLPRLSVLTIELDELLQIDPKRIARAICQTVEARQSFSPRLSELRLVDFDLDEPEKQRRNLEESLERHCDSIIWEFSSS